MKALASLLNYLGTITLGIRISTFFSWGGGRYIQSIANTMESRRNLPRDRWKNCGAARAYRTKSMSLVGSSVNFYHYLYL
jgi:hypothetical protein